MNIILVLLAGVVVGFVLTLIISKRKSAKKILREQEKRKKENLDRVMEYLKENPRITNDEVEKMLGVSHATSFRYLDQLEEEGAIRQMGKTGSGVYYEKS